MTAEESKVGVGEVGSHPSVAELGLGLVVGGMWGVGNMGVVWATGWPELEGSLTANAVAFACGGSLMGLATTLVLAITGLGQRRRSIKQPLLVTSGIWLVFILGGLALSLMDPDRHSVSWPELARGLVMTLGLGVALGIVFNRRSGSHE